MAITFNKVSYKDKLKNINYTFEEEKITVVLSSSGNGKTLLSYLLAGLIKEYDGEMTNKYTGRELGYIFQEPEESFIFSTVKEELIFGLKKYNYKTEILDKRIKDSLKMVGLKEEYLDKNPFELSSGEKTLLSLAITLSLNPKLLIIDEPTTYLDNKNKDYLIKLIKKLKNNYHKTIIILTSDINLTLSLADNYLLLKNGKITSEGKIKEIKNNIDKIKNAGVEVPKIIEFIIKANKKKHINLDMNIDIKELMKDIYRNVK